MTVEQNKAVIRRIFDEVWNQGKVDRIAIRTLAADAPAGDR